MLAILRPIEYVVAWIMVAFHKVFTAIGMDPAGGLAWSLSIVGLVVVIRILLIPLFVKQIKAQRGLQALQPEMKKIQEKYKNDKQRQQQELMKLYKETGTNPLSSCLPIIAQAPIFFALFRVLNGIAHDQGIGPLTDELAQQAGDATIFGAPISASFLNAPNLNTKIVSVILIILMSATTFTTQRQLMTKNMPASGMTGPFAQQQKLLLYVLPIVFAVSGVNFPIGVLLYWLTTNLWSMGQQFYVIRRNPTPGSVAYEHLERKRAEKAKAAAKPITPPPGDSSGPDASPPPRPSGQRQQPKRQKRQQRGSGSTSRNPSPPEKTP